MSKKSIAKSTEDTKRKINAEQAQLQQYLAELLTSPLWPVPSMPPPSQGVIMSIREKTDIRKKFIEHNEAFTTLRSQLKLPERPQTPEDGEIPFSVNLGEPLPPARKVQPSDLSELAAQLPEIEAQVQVVRDAQAAQKPTPDVQALWETKKEELLRSSGVDARIEELQDQLTSARRDIEQLREENAALRNANEAQRAAIERLGEQAQHVSFFCSSTWRN